MKFQCVYADPPWQYRVFGRKGHGQCAENHYRTMSKEEIYNLPVDSITDENCVLFLWVTFPCLLEGLETMRKWGFKYKTLGFVWVKRYKKQTDKWVLGLGFWTRSNPEICLIGTKGNIRRVSKSVSSVVDTIIEQHSKKPDVVREKIVELMGDIPRIELFARQQYEGWVCVGDEINEMDIYDSLKTIASDESQDAN